jgi:cysteine-rich repeat protein
MRFLLALICLLSVAAPSFAVAQQVATTTLDLSICGNTVVDGNEDCDIPGETGVYSQTIVGRQCTASCTFGPYCGDGILQTGFGEECDDGNNDDGDFCSALCVVEPAGSGGGGSSGGGSGGGGGSDTELGDTQISVRGQAYPGERVNFLLDTVSVGSVLADNDGDFQFSVNADAGTATLGIWTTDRNNNRSITINNTFDVTQGAITNLTGIIVPPTITVPAQNVDPGDVVTVSGQAAAGATVELHIDDSSRIEIITADSNGVWSYELNTATLSIAEHTMRARAVVGRSPLTTESGFSTTLQLFVGVDGSATQPSDLNRDGFVNLIDFSILIFWWQTNGGDSDPPADINQNGNTGLEDFSILLFNWTG